ncbi:MAG: hypothetical protein WBM39_04040 [Parasphingorhabdus sp.]
MTNVNADNLPGQVSTAQRDKRACKLIRVDIERENGPGFSAIVTNLSEQGMGGRSEGFLRPFELVTIIKQGYGRISGEVRWIEGQNFGVLFSEPVDVDQFNFTDHNKQKHFVQPGSDGHVWKGYETASSTKRPGVTNRFSK